jgi:hypothetical protein
MKHFTLLAISIHLILSAQSQYDVDIKPKEAALTKKQEAALEMEKIGKCRFIPLSNYKEGMKFYFPRDEYKEKETDDVLYYYLAKEEKKGRYNRSKIAYKELAGKVFEIIKVEDKEILYSKKKIITLKNTENDYVIQYESPGGLGFDL